jgi:hypothetical protein
MGRSFFNGSTDSELAAGSRAFANQIGSAWADYGIPEAMAQAYVELDAEWRAAYMAANNASLRTTGVVARKNELRQRITAMASRLAQMISGNPDVSDAQRISLGLSVRAPAAPLPPPGTPTAPTVKLDSDGSLILTWKCDNPPGSRGTQYEISRKLAGGDFVFLKQVGVKRFRDHTLPVGATGIVYRLRAIRSTKAGDVAQFPVSFGGGIPDMFHAKRAA